MTQIKHTPAPWIVRGDKKVVSQAKGFAGLEVANCMTYDASISQRAANAHLIAAAPDMLAMLKRVFKVMPSRMEEGGQLLEGEIAALINKAEGVA